MPLQDVGDRRPANPVADVVQRTLDPCVSPARILSRHSDGEFRNDLHYSTSARGSPLVGPLLSNELPVPTQDGVGCDERCNLGESPSPNSFAAHGKPSPLRVGQSKSSSTELLLEDAVLFAEIVDDRILLACDPTGHGGYEDLPRLDRRHPVIVATPTADQQLST